ncbi:uncharacterized protein VTP21DRAFT_2706 [Calcarisporiella thermophila]|uniref:uncharacterized protein n=1 Tax=Calcarisporiella thermophila TaxID=911321 RepID=UPI003742A77E
MYPSGSIQQPMAQPMTQQASQPTPQSPQRPPKRIPVASPRRKIAYLSRNGIFNNLFNAGMDPAHGIHLDTEQIPAQYRRRQKKRREGKWRLFGGGLLRPYNREAEKDEEWEDYETQQGTSTQHYQQGPTMTPQAPVMPGVMPPGMAAPQQPLAGQPTWVAPQMPVAGMVPPGVNGMMNPGVPPQYATMTFGQPFPGHGHFV